MKEKDPRIKRADEGSVWRLTCVIFHYGIDIMMMMMIIMMFMMFLGILL